MFDNTTGTFCLSDLPLLIRCVDTTDNRTGTSIARFFAHIVDVFEKFFGVFENMAGTSFAQFFLIVDVLKKFLDMLNNIRSLIVEVLDMFVDVFDNTSDIHRNVDMLDPGSA